MRMFIFHLAVAAAWLLASCPLRAQEKTDKLDPAAVEFFEKKIRPVLAEHCYRCHSTKAAKIKGNLQLDTRAGLRKGGDNGPALVAGQPGKSLLLKALRHEGDIQMPPKGKLSDDVIADFERWIALGAPDPREGTQSAVKDIDWNEARRSWAFQPPTKHPLPQVKNAWAKKDLDHFLLAELDKRGLKPVRPATKLELIRRATFDLIGLPPTPEEIDAFLKDETADAFARVVDRLLSSPHYGERWGRYWLDLARFADDKALAMSQPYPHAHRYRDWVVQAFNQDMPYDRFVRLQLAGDMVGTPPAGTPDRLKEALQRDAQLDNFTRLAGLGFQGLGAEYHKGNFAAQVMADELDDRVDTLTRAMLGLTVACARCHDHKYDPIPTLDYYSLAAAYQGSTLSQLPLATPEETAKFEAWQREAKQRDAKLLKWSQEKTRALGKQALSDAGAYLLLAWKLRLVDKTGDVDAAVAGTTLRPYFLKKTLKFYDSPEAGKVPVLQAWLKTAQTAAAAGKSGRTDLAIPDELRKATDELQRQISKDLEGDAKKSALIKVLALDATGPFALVDKELPGVLAGPERQEFDALKSDVDNHKKAAPPAPTMIHGVKGGGQAMRVHIRGNVERLGEPAPPGFLQVLKARNDKPGQFTRLELALAVATADNPLTARVFVNRVWQHHFGRGIVATPSNFGKLGERPTHPELLDTLAVHFIEAGWSVQWLHREMMLSAAYQMSSVHDADNAGKDADNRYLWRMPAQRLDFEAWRDALLAVSGRLDATLGGPSGDLLGAKFVRRTIYSRVSRAVPNSMLTMFDFPDANVSSDRRSVTTVPQQQLFVLNSEFMVENARAFAARLEKNAGNDEQRVTLAFRLAYGRVPDAQERRLSLEFLRGAAAGRMSPLEQFAQAILAANEFAWVD